VKLKEVTAKAQRRKGAKKFREAFVFLCAFAVQAFPEK
jgi:hypothetical protein